MTDLYSKTFTDFLASADLEMLRRKRAWLAEYARNTYNGHSEIGRNLRAYDAEIARRERATALAERDTRFDVQGVGNTDGYGGDLMEGGY